jgi:hypothetical protein
MFREIKTFATLGAKLDHQPHALRPDDASDFIRVLEASDKAILCGMKCSVV